jgi:ubiquinone/menaquinone biosynthesis C-methylase UbiE
MSESASLDPTKRFDGLAQVYSECRPNYPDEAINLIVTHCRLHGDSVLADVGCGTGISSRLFAKRGIQVVGIEPNDEMRHQAETDSADMSDPPPIFVPGQAEATGLADYSVDAVLAAQSFHWFDPQAALTEFHRILKTKGWIVLMWNERDDRDHFTAAYSKLMRSLSEAAAIEIPRGKAGHALLKDERFSHHNKFLFQNEQTLDEKGFLGRSFSASYAPKDEFLRQQFANLLQELFNEYMLNGTVVIRYETSIFFGQKTGGVGF